MKKLSLEMLRLSTEEVLERSQMARVTGGNWAYWHCSCGGGPQFTVFTDSDDPTELTLCQPAVAVCTPAPTIG
ncbi:hypothetical protein [uncultured Algoriphagus sp.]|mgnify:CR=1 FL=1|uniref:hypothetical protein n=1 Tax=Algoriphagus formosus TaxID=2007308 RepID=UPI00258DCC01|nr:hypothetical protein [uncultured Algoriphagus sp.]